MTNANENNELSDLDSAGSRDGCSSLKRHQKRSTEKRYVQYSTVHACILLQCSTECRRIELEDSIAYVLARINCMNNIYRLMPLTLAPFLYIQYVRYEYTGVLMYSVTSRGIIIQQTSIVLLLTALIHFTVLVVASRTFSQAFSSLPSSLIHSFLHSKNTIYLQGYYSHRRLLLFYIS